MYCLVQCPKCGWRQVSHFRAQSVICRKCGKNFVLRPKGKPSRIIAGPFKRFHDARKALMEVRA